MCRLLRVLPGQIVMLTFKVHGCQGAMGSDVCRVKTYGLLQRGEHGFRVAILRQRHREEVVRIGHLGHDSHQHTELAYCSGGLAALQVSEAQVEVRFGVARVKP